MRSEKKLQSIENREYLTCLIDYWSPNFVKCTLIFGKFTQNQGVNPILAELQEIHTTKYELKLKEERSHQLQ